MINKLKTYFILGLCSLLILMLFQNWWRGRKLGDLENQLNQVTRTEQPLKNRLSSRGGVKEGWKPVVEPCVPIVHYINARSEKLQTSVSRQLAIVSQPGSRSGDLAPKSERLQDQDANSLLLGQFQLGRLDWGGLGIVQLKPDSKQQGALGAVLTVLPAKEPGLAIRPLLEVGPTMGLDSFGQYHGLYAQFGQIKLGPLWLTSHASLRSYRTLSPSVPEDLKHEFSSVFDASVSLGYRFNLHKKR